MKVNSNTSNNINADNISFKNLRSYIIKHKVGLSILILPLIILYILGDYLTIVISPTSSLQHHIFFGIKNQKIIDYNRIITFTISNIRFMKKIVGKPGDLIGVIDNKVFINDKVLGVVGECKKVDSKGNKLTCIKSQTIPKDHYFVAGTHEDSFDSRYEEFGLIKEQDILYNAYPLFSSKAL